MTDYRPEDSSNFSKTDAVGSQKQTGVPFGLPALRRRNERVKQILLSESLQDRSVLDVGSGLGQMCVTALQQGAKRAVGVEPHRDRIRQAREISDSLQLSPAPEYRHEDLENMELNEDFDIVLLLNVLHHLRDPIAVLRKLTKHVKHRLIVEAASPGDREASRTKRGSLSRLLFWKHPVAYVGSYRPNDLSQTYFFSSEALSRILSQHQMPFWRIDHYPSGIKGRFILDCRKLSIDRMILVAGCNSSGKSTFCKKVRQNEFSEQLNYTDYSDEVFVSPAKLWGKPLDTFFPTQRTGECLVHYDISLVDKFGLHSFDRDPATSIIECSDTIDAVLIAPSPETVKHQLVESEIKNRPAKKSVFHRKHLERLDEPDFLLNLYSDWLDYLEGLDSAVNLYIYREVSDGRQLTKCQSMAEARKHIHDIYGSA